MKLGFTGTREGMTDAQKVSVLELIKRLNPTEAHHGDCIGADKEFFELCEVVSRSRVEEIWTVAHPPKNDRLRAYTDSHAIREPKDYMPRNIDIVDECDELIAAPKQDVKPVNLKGSGTWQTEDYAERKPRKVYIVWPDGSIKPVG
jgi:hypothetical protein